ncbi:hypothetical protein UFOVP742_44 [uncultured Caudovirales phage]|uniref:Uncharacterized protein n=1 Tax=uncultured Caudovirales phage TaxID=2100421 RepID=A0A6J7X2M0_9CAUD|nr:hypothetical protein UFOVP742_44 [uncultured Caudovirales phage]
MTIPEWEQLVDTLYEQTRSHIKLLGHVSRDDVDGYLSFYGVHDSIYVAKQDGVITGISTVHPGVGDFNWKWRKPNGIWTIHLAWAKCPKAVAEMFNQFFARKSPITQAWAWRYDHASPITPKKLERLLYGRK